jgi:hypothetical protein
MQAMQVSLFDLWFQKQTHFLSAQRKISTMVLLDTKTVVKNGGISIRMCPLWRFK